MAQGHLVAKAARDTGFAHGAATEDDGFDQHGLGPVGAIHIKASLQTPPVKHDQLLWQLMQNRALGDRKACADTRGARCAAIGAFCGLGGQDQAAVRPCAGRSLKPVAACLTARGVQYYGFDGILAARKGHLASAGGSEAVNARASVAALGRQGHGTDRSRGAVRLS